MSSGPASIGVIMDGNRRWARERGLPTLEGHRRGYEKVEELLTWCRAEGVDEVILYAFSTENWSRSPEEVSYLMVLFEDALPDVCERLARTGVRIRFVGERKRFSPGLREKMRELEEKSAEGAEGTLALALSYGGRPEILAAVNRLLSEGRAHADEASFVEAMWSAGLRDPDLIIRTGGERRLSNFLPWQSVYSELFFTDTKWPDFGEEEFGAILADFRARERRRGK